MAWVRPSTVPHGLLRALGLKNHLGEPPAFFPMCVQVWLQGRPQTMTMTITHPSSHSLTRIPQAPTLWQAPCSPALPAMPMEQLLQTYFL